MFPSYNSQKVVHDQMIQEALERSQPDDGQAPHRQGLRQIMQGMLARFTTSAGQQQAKPIPCHAQRESGALS